MRGLVFGERLLQGLLRTRSTQSPRPLPCRRVVRGVSEGSVTASDMKVKLALCQFKVTPEKDKNFQTARKAIENAEDVDGGASKSATFLSDLAKEHRVTLVGGSIPELSDGKTYNTCLVYDESGKLIAKHRKVHLFDIDIPGKQTFKESETLSAGGQLTVVDTSCGKLGIGICYDIRFPDMAAIYARKGVQLLLYPGAFNSTTGPAHWTLLARARAVDNQLFVALCSQSHSPEASYSVYGHSLVVSPWGEVLAEAAAEPTTVYATLDYSEVEERRRNMPLAQQRRKDLYELVDKGQ